MGYAVAAYVLVLGTLLVYGLRLEWERRTLARREQQRPRAAPGAR